MRDNVNGIDAGSPLQAGDDLIEAVGSVANQDNFR